MESRLTQSELYYLLGFGFLEFNSTDQVVLTKRKTGVFASNFDAIKDISYRLYAQNRVVTTDKNVFSLAITEPDVAKFITENGVLTPKKYVPTMPPSMKMAFAAGFLEGYGEFSFSSSHLTPRIFVRANHEGAANFLAQQWNVEPSDKLIINGYKALDVMGAISAHTPYKESKNVQLFWQALNLGTYQNTLKNKSFYYHKLSPKAVPPQKFRVTDSGYDLHVVELTKLYTTYFGAEVYKAKTELAVKPVLGQAFDIAGRSGGPDKGWQFLQGVGICDRSYTGGIAATMMRLTSDPLPAMPWRCLQLIPRQAPIHLPFEERNDLGDSDRGDKGFGSSDNRKLT